MTAFHHIVIELDSSNTKTCMTVPSGERIPLFLHSEMAPTFKQMLKQAQSIRAELAKQKKIHELIQTIKAIDLIGADSTKYRNKLRILIAAKSNE